MSEIELLYASGWEMLEHEAILILTDDLDDFNKKKKLISSALKLQELVKERIEQLFPTNSASDDYDEALILQSLLEESVKVTGDSVLK